MEKKNEPRVRSCVGLSRKQFDFLEKISRCCRYSGGKKLSKAAVIRCLLNVMKEVDIDIQNVRSEEQLKERIIKAFSKYR